MKSVDIVVPVYYAPELSVRTIQSVFRNTDFTKFDVKVIVVDDTGKPEFSQLLQFMLEKVGLQSKVTYVAHETNKGFIEACYTGISQREADYKLLLNSDTYVMEGWLTEMIKTAESDEKIALINPLTNRFPEIETPMPQGTNINILHKYAQSIDVNADDYIDIVTAGGFCLLIKDQYIKQYGFFDRIYDFGYCEESDLHFRYLTQGLRAVISTKAFVYHRGEASFDDTNERYQKNIKILWSRYKDVYEGTYPIFHEQSVLHKHRKALAEKRELDIDVLVVGSTDVFKFGGMKVLNNICNALNENGISTSMTTVFQESESEELLDQMYKPIPITELLKYDIKPKVILYSFATNAQEIVRLERHFSEKYNYRPEIVHIVQDIEGWFWGNDIEKFITYTMVADERFTVSPFLQETLKTIYSGTKLEADVITNSISLDFKGNALRRAVNKSTDEIVIATMMRKDQKRGAQLIESALAEIDSKLGSLTKKVKLVTFGDYKMHTKYHNISTSEVGFIEESKVMNILAEADIFIEASLFQGFGLTALEALFSDCLVISSNNKGAESVLPTSKNIKLFKIGDVNDLAKNIFEAAEAISTHGINPVDNESIYQYSHRNKSQEYHAYFTNILGKLTPETLADKNRNNFYEKALNTLLAYIDNVKLNPMLLEYNRTRPNRLRYKVVDKALGTITKNKLAYSGLRKIAQAGKKLFAK